MKTVKFRKKVWFVVWPKSSEEECAPAAFYPLGVEPYKNYTYYDRNEKRNCYGFPMASFETRDEAVAFNNFIHAGKFVVRAGTIEVL